MSLKNRNIKINKAIFDIKAPEIDYSKFSNYKDFMSNRHLVSYYKFEYQFLDQLFSTIEFTFKNKGRYNRAKLLETLNSYIYNHKSKLKLVERERIFRLVKQCFENKEIAKSVKRPAYYLLVNLPLFPEGEEWLCKMATHYNPYDPTIRFDFVTRVLRYPIKSDVIYNWVSEKYQDDKLRLRRAETVGWMLNDNPSFVVECKTLIDDFEYTNEKDLDIIQTMIRGIAMLIIEVELEVDEISFDNYSKRTHRHKLTQRPYAYITYHYSHGSEPDFSMLRQFFYNNIEKIRNQTMLWAVAYSHLPKKEKIKLIKQFYMPELFVSAFNIAKKYKLIELLEWLNTQNAETKDSEYHFELNREFEKQGLNY